MFNKQKGKSPKITPNPNPKIKIGHSPDGRIDASPFRNYVAINAA
jgi:hypothetical protein